MPASKKQEAEARVGMPLRRYIVKRLNAGAVWRKIADELGVSPTTLWAWRKDLRIDMRAR